jgi:hypothetical protein
MAVINIDIPPEEFTSALFLNFGGPVEDPQHTLHLPVGTVIKITAPADTSSDTWAVPEAKGGDKERFSIALSAHKYLPDGRISRRFLVHQTGKADIPLFLHGVGNQLVRVYGIPHRRGHTEMRQELRTRIQQRIHSPN